MMSKPGDAILQTIENFRMGEATSSGTPHSPDGLRFQIKSSSIPAPPPSASFIDNQALSTPSSARKKIHHVKADRYAGGITKTVVKEMRIQLIGILTLAVLTTRLSADYTEITFTQFLEKTTSIIWGKVKGFTPPSHPEDPMSFCILSISVEDTFKGEAKREVQVRAHTYSSLEIKKLPLLVGKTFLVFMHEPRQEGAPWLYGGPRGLKPISDNYSELVTTVEGSQDESTYFMKEFSQQDYLAILRRNKLTQHERERP